MAKDDLAPLRNHPELEFLVPGDLMPSPGNPRTHSRRQIGKIATSIERFGFTNPILVDGDGGVIAGHGRLAAARQLGLDAVPVLRFAHLTPEERRAYVLADNRLAEEAGWDRSLLALELEALIDVDFDLELTGFDLAEIDVILDSAQAASPDPATPAIEAEDLIPAVSDGPTVTRPGDLWRMGRHRLHCGDALDIATVHRLVGETKIDLIFTDPPYNVPIAGHVSGLGAVTHREFAMGSGEMDAAAFTGFLKQALGNAADTAKDGAIAFVCMDWRHMEEVLAAGGQVFSELKNLCVWNKTNGGMGTFYRSKHELVFVWKVGTAPHLNTFGLGETGRYRTNVWDYAGVNVPKTGRAEALAMHPTVKPVRLIADAIKDCTRRGEVVLDVFGGSGSTLIAAESSGRSARLLELDPIYCDTILRRWQAYASQPAIHEGTGHSFDDVAAAVAEVPA